MGILMQALMAVSGLNVLLLLPIVYVYGKSLLETKSTFSIGLFLFALLLLVQNAFSLYYFVTMMPLFAAGLEPYVLTYSGLQLVAYGILNWVIWK